MRKVGKCSHVVRHGPGYRVVIMEEGKTDLESQPEFSTTSNMLCIVPPFLPSLTSQLKSHAVQLSDLPERRRADGDSLYHYCPGSPL